MKICLVGAGGTVAPAIANAMLLQTSGLELALAEPWLPAQKKMMGEFWDLIPVAKATGNRLVKQARSTRVPVKAQVYVVCTGVPRTDPHTPKTELFSQNLGIVIDAIKDCNRKARYYIVTNPPNQIAEALQQKGINAIPCRECTDELRQTVGNRESINKAMLQLKGTSQWTAGYAIARFVLEGEGLI